MSRYPVSTQILGLALWMAVTFAAAAVGALASIGAEAFYAQLEQPRWAPPASAFGPVWTVLYVLMGVAAWLVWRVAGFGAARGPLVLFLVQLAVNALWTWLFFAWHRGLLSVLDIAILIVLVVATLIGFWRVRPLAGLLLVPYLCWASYALALNYTLWQRNPALLV